MTTRVSDILSGDAYENADFASFDFGDESKATAAERFFPTSVVNTGAALEIRLDGFVPYADEVAGKLAEAGLSYKLSPSSLTEADMWPTEPGDDDATPPGP